MNKEKSKIEKVQETAVEYKTKKMRTLTSQKTELELEINRLTNKRKEVARILTESKHKTLKNELTSNFLSYLSDSKTDTFKVFCDLPVITKLPINFLSEFVFEITPKTYNAYKEEQKLPSHIFEKTIKLNELYKKGLELFGNVEKFNEWLSVKSYGLGDQIPLNMINTVIGIDMVLDELYKIEFGTTA